MNTSSATTAVSVSHIAKTFGKTAAVHDVSFDVSNGEIFGLLGPNGAGKTTSIRLILDIFKPDHGNISVLGGKIDESKKEKIGYLPEERGLYKDMRVEECVLYLAALKGLPRRVAKERAAKYFEQLDLTEHKSKKVNDLSKGMQQKVQVITTLIHHPQLIIIDEPFSGLDPVNTRLIQDMLVHERERGAAIIMSTHQMFQVEEMCDRIVLINQGDSVLYGRVDDIRQRYADNTVRVSVRPDLPSIARVIETHRKGNWHTLRLPEDMTPQALLRQLADTPDVFVDAFERAIPTMDDIFVKVVSPIQRSAE